MPDIHYESAKLAAIYDLDSGWSEDRDFYLSLPDSPNQRILDLGCGTGLLCDAYAAQGHTVTGVDPSAAMLDVARKKTHGPKIEWVQSTAETYRSDVKFDLIIMTGHAFQVLLEDTQILSALAVMKRHLKPDGRIVFESRNPKIAWENNWNYDMSIKYGDDVVQESRKFLEYKNSRMSFELQYKFPDETLISKSELRFLSKQELEERLTAVGLYVDQVFGDWDSSAFDEATSEEMIFIIRPAP